MWKDWFSPLTSPWFQLPSPTCYTLRQASSCFVHCAIFREAPCKPSIKLLYYLLSNPFLQTPFLWCLQKNLTTVRLLVCKDWCPVCCPVLVHWFLMFPFCYLLYPVATCLSKGLGRRKLCDSPTVDQEWGKWRRHHSSRSFPRAGGPMCCTEWGYEYQEHLCL